MLRAIQRDGVKGIVMLMMMLGGLACDRGPEAGPDVAKTLPSADVDEARTSQPDASAEASATKTKTAVLAGGCFWCVEAVFEQLDGVEKVVSGYAGDSAETADYDSVSSGATQHAEAVRVTYDPSKISYGELLRVFFATHDPTQLNRQGPDTGAQYRSTVFYADDEQKRIAEAYIAQLEQAGAFDRPIVTTLEPLADFYTAEDDHQDFVSRHPNHPYVRAWALPKVAKVRDKFSDQIKSR